MFNVSLCGREPCDRNAVRRAGNIIEPDLVAELDRRRIAAVLAADAEVHVRAGLLAELHCHVHKFAYADLVELSKRIGFIDLLLIICGQELAGIVAREAERHLRAVILCCPLDYYLSFQFYSF